MADSKELTNYAAGYAISLLVARILMKDKSIDTQLKESQATPDCKYLDIGLVRMTTGDRIFGAMKSARDAGLSMPHREA